MKIKSDIVSLLTERRTKCCQPAVDHRLTACEVATLRNTLALREAPFTHAWQWLSDKFPTMQSLEKYTWIFAVEGRCEHPIGFDRILETTFNDRNGRKITADYGRFCHYADCHGVRDVVHHRRQCLVCGVVH